MRRYANLWSERARRGRTISSTSLDRKSTRLNSSHLVISYAVFCLKKKILPEDQANLLAPYIVGRVQGKDGAKLLDRHRTHFGDGCPKKLCHRRAGCLNAADTSDHV